jgi:hypothetical protein
MKTPLHDFLIPQSQRLGLLLLLQQGKTSQARVELGRCRTEVSLNGFYFGFLFFACGCETFALRCPFLMDGRPLAFDVFFYTR